MVTVHLYGSLACILVHGKNRLRPTVGGIIWLARPRSKFEENINFAPDACLVRARYGRIPYNPGCSLARSTCPFANPAVRPLCNERRPDIPAWSIPRGTNRIEPSRAYPIRTNNCIDLQTTLAWLVGLGPRLMWPYFLSSACGFHSAIVMRSFGLSTRQHYLTQA